MPLYDYYCEANQQTVEVRHPARVTLHCWGEVCYAAQLPLGETDPLAPVRRVISPPYVTVPVSDTRLKDLGFTKLVRRDNGVYENVTASDKEQRYMRAGEQDSVPDLRRKIRD